MEKQKEVKSRIATYIDVDVHRKNLQAVAMDEEGTILRDERLRIVWMT